MNNCKLIIEIENNDGNIVYVRYLKEFKSITVVTTTDAHGIITSCKARAKNDTNLETFIKDAIAFTRNRTIEEEWVDVILSNDTSLRIDKNSQLKETLYLIDHFDEIEQTF